ncbi:MAG: helix-turn-helix domain-containing protein [Acidimicrobiia bacterium]|nr:helix-turn-helix domain-containing protein [Acidimicrobiia bacterium]
MIDAVTPLIDAVGGELIAPDSVEPGDVLLEWKGRVVTGVRLPRLQGALQRVIATVEDQLGAPLSDLSREDKQRAVAMLDKLGAFTLRKGVEDVADALAVSRFTVYNYLNAVNDR